MRSARSRSFALLLSFIFPPLTIVFHRAPSQMDEYFPGFEDGLEPMQLVSEQSYPDTQGTIESLQAELLRYKIALQTTQ